MARSMASSSCPAAPTKGSPRRSSSAPGASPITSQPARFGPTPSTPWVRVACSGQRVDSSTAARSASQRASISAAGAALSPVRAASTAPRPRRRPGGRGDGGGGGQPGGSRCGRGAEGRGEGRHYRRGGRARQRLEVALVGGGGGGVEAREAQRRGHGVEEAGEPAELFPE